MRVALGVLVALVLAGCGATEPPPPAPSGRPTYELPPRTARPDERPLRAEPVVEGETSFTPVGLTTGIASLLGSHAEWEAKGRYTRVRVSVTNAGRSTTQFNTRRQLLVTADGTTAVPDEQAMLIKRQPGTFDLGANVVVEFDLYYDIPVDAKPRALRVFGGPTLSDAHDATGTDIPLPV